MERLRLSKPELLLGRQIPKPLHEIAPRTILGRKWWDIQRKAAYAERGYRCWGCGVHQSEAKYCKGSLDCHERYEIQYNTGRVLFLGVCALCRACHHYIHEGFMEAMVRTGKMSRYYMEGVLAYGAQVLRKAGLPLRPEYPPESECAEWSAWRLVLLGKEYGPSTQSFEEWEQKFGLDSHRELADAREALRLRLQQKGQSGETK